MVYFTNVFLERVGHTVLVCSWGITSTLWHDGPFIESPRCSYGSEVNVVGVYPGLEEGVSHIHLPENFPFTTVSFAIIDLGGVFDLDAVEHVARDFSSIVWELEWEAVSES
jgi:hypothetical protein